jgi:flagellar basal-body rod protein FlgG
MSEILAIALNSMQNDMRQVEHVAMNLANTLTPGYKRQVAAAQSFGAIVEQGAASAAGQAPALSGAVQTFVDVRAGALKQTGGSLDLAVDGQGYFEVATDAGPAYTRQGDFRVDERGRLVTAQGQPVMGLGGEILLSGAKPRIDRNGNVFDAGDANAKTPLAQLKLVRFEEAGTMASLGNGLLSAGGGMVQLNGAEIHLRQGYLEGSNVSTQTEMVQLMQATRHFESMQKAIQSYDEVVGTAIRKLGEV